MKFFRKQWLIFLALFAFVLDACSASTQSATATISITPTSTPIPSTPTPEPINRLERICDKGRQTANETSNLPGSLVYSAEKGAFLLDLSSFHTKNIFKIVRDRYPIILISPNHDVVATTERGFENSRPVLQKIWIASRDEEFSIAFPKSEDDPYYSYLIFLDSQNILLTSQEVLDKNYVGNGTNDKVYTLSLDTKEFAPNSIFLPNFSLREHQFSGPNDNYDPPWTVYSPDFKYVAYPIQQDWDKNSILNIENGETILFDWWKIGFAYPYPFWRLDSKMLTIVKPDSASRSNYFNIGLDGGITQLTRLEDVAGDSYFLDSYGASTWSPNSRYLAFPIYRIQSNGNSGTIFVLDTQNGNVFDLCYSEAWPRLNERVFWSPDSRYLATDVEGKTQIIDIENKIIYDLDTKSQLGVLGGWVNWQIP